MSTPFSDIFAKINQISPLEHKFTEVLDSIALKPKTLYFYGKIPENERKISARFLFVHMWMFFLKLIE